MCDECNFLLNTDLLTDENPVVRDNIGYHADKVLRTLAEDHGYETGAKHQPIPFGDLPGEVIEKLPGVFGVCTYIEGDDLKEEKLYEGKVSDMLLEYDLSVSDLMIPV